ncbi:MAG: hypothetical protein QOF55_1553 [Thermoleophilaceae bacterium]|nr:hypothetical protein [Thermoleophilaceae bacterium]
MSLPVSVVVAAFNRADTVERALASVAAQLPERPAEVIVVDDASSDDTAELAARHGARVIRHEANRGPSAARNTGIAAAEHAWIAPLDADDEWLPDHLARLWAVRGQHVIAAGSCLWLDEAGSVTRFEGPAGAGPLQIGSPAELLFPENHVPASAVLLRREVVERVGCYDERLRRAEDLDLWIRMLEHGTGVVLPSVVSLYHVHGGQATQDTAAMRAAHEAVALAYVSRPWCTPALLERVRAVARWDELREVQRAGRRGAALMMLASLLARPRRAAALAKLLQRRRALRAKAARAAAPIARTAT